MHFLLQLLHCANCPHSVSWYSFCLEVFFIPVLSTAVPGNILHIRSSTGLFFSAFWSVDVIFVRIYVDMSYALCDVRSQRANWCRQPRTLTNHRRKEFWDFSQMYSRGPASNRYLYLQLSSGGVELQALWRKWETECQCAPLQVMSFPCLKDKQKNFWWTKWKLLETVFLSLWIVSEISLDWFVKRILLRPSSLFRFCNNGFNEKRHSVLFDLNVSWKKKKISATYHLL